MNDSHYEWISSRGSGHFIYWRPALIRMEPASEIEELRKTTNFVLDGFTPRNG